MDRIDTPLSRPGQSDKKTSETRVILITYPDKFVKEEAQGLVEAAGYTVAVTVTQKRFTHPQYGIGSGKAQEIRNLAEDENTTMIVVDDRLSSAQAHNLAKFTHQQVIDRERLILDIFNSRATTTEAKLQVKLAELKYEIPRAREAVRVSLKGEQAGFMGMGEYAVDVKFRALKKQMGLIQKKLEEARKRRELFKISRERLNAPFVSLAGYTSSGKTTLFNRLVSEHKEESSNLFTTLTTTTRSFQPLPGRKVLLSDTVGFISRLPTYMIEAFKSTLEELTEADLILLMIDVSEPVENVEVKYQSCRHVLDQLGINPFRILIVMNKIDLLSREEIEQRAQMFAEMPAIGVSKRESDGTRKLRVKMAQRLFEGEDVSEQNESVSEQGIFKTLSPSNV
ncbi:MAG: GTPase HflX [Thaumarchaeota archaeon]|nr:GTPase HflX [Nitrososphaerota archaeon]